MRIRLKARMLVKRRANRLNVVDTTLTTSVPTRTELNEKGSTKFGVTPAGGWSAGVLVKSNPFVLAIINYSNVHAQD